MALAIVQPSFLDGILTQVSKTRSKSTEENYLCPPQARVAPRHTNLSPQARKNTQAHEEFLPFQQLVCVRPFSPCSSYDRPLPFVQPKPILKKGASKRNVKKLVRIVDCSGGEWKRRPVKGGRAKRLLNSPREIAAYSALQARRQPVFGYNYLVARKHFLSKMFQRWRKNVDK